MAFESHNFDDPYAPPHADSFDQQAQYGVQRKQSGIGIASFVIAVGGGVTAFVLVAAAGMMEASNPGGLDEESPMAILLGLGLIAIVGLSLLGMGLGLVGILQANRLRAFAVMGLVLNAMILLGLAALFVIGMAATA